MFAGKSTLNSLHMRPLASRCATFASGPKRLAIVGLHLSPGAHTKPPGDIVRDLDNPHSSLHGDQDERSCYCYLLFSSACQAAASTIDSSAGAVENRRADPRGSPDVRDGKLSWFACRRLVLIWEMVICGRSRHVETQLLAIYSIWSFA